MNIEIANRLVNLRKSNNLSQEALAEKLGISRQAVSKWERAEASPDTDNLILLARLYGVSLDELLSTEDEIPMPEKEDIKTADDINREKPDEVPQRAHFPVTLIIVIVYVTIGCVYNAWHPGWLLFLLIPIWNSLIQVIEQKNPQHFAYPVLMAIVYLCLGFFYGMWYPGWIVFLTIPLYYSLINYFRGLKGNRKGSDFQQEGIGDADEME